MVRKYAPIILMGLLLAGCEKRDREIHTAAIEPSISGVWAGNITINGVSSAVQLNLQQNDVAVLGTYTSNNTAMALAHSGSLKGATTGPTFSLSITGDTPACFKTLQMGGQNDGTSLAGNLIGTDCDDVTPLRGQLALSKQP